MPGPDERARCDARCGPAAVLGSSQACRCVFRRTRRYPAGAASPSRCRTAIEQRAAKHGVPIDARIEHGRDRPQALRGTIAHETYDRVVIARVSSGQ